MYIQLTEEEQKKEIWKIIEEDGLQNYAISNMGRCKNISTNKFLKLSKMSDSKGTIKFGYHLQSVIGGVKKNKVKWAHMLVGNYFIKKPNKKKKYLFKHIDGNITNNRASNLELITKNESPNSSEDIFKPHKLKNGYSFSMTIEGKSYNMGTYKTIEEAQKIRELALENIKNNIDWCFKPHISKIQIISLIEKGKSNFDIANLLFPTASTHWTVQKQIYEFEKEIELIRRSIDS